MVDFGCEANLRWLERIVLRELELKEEKTLVVWSVLLNHGGEDGG